MRIRRRKADQRRGAALVEFALVVFPMVLLMLACFEVSRLFMIQSVAENATFDALRDAMLPGAVKADAVAIVNAKLALLGTQGATVTVTPYEGTTAQTDIDDDTDEVEVIINVPMASNTFLLSAFTKNITIIEQARMETERYKGYYDGTSS